MLCPYRRNIVPPFIFEYLLLSLVLFISSHFHLPDITILDWWSFQPLPSSQSVFGCFSLDMIAILSVSRSPELKVSINHMLALLHYNQHLDSRGSYEDVSRIKLPKSFSAVTSKIFFNTTDLWLSCQLLFLFFVFIKSQEDYQLNF